MSGFGLSRLEPAEGRIPEPGSRDLLVRVKAVSLNYKDRMIVDGVLIPDLAFLSCRPQTLSAKWWPSAAKSAASASGSACLAR
ncbi:hypothetical protein [Mesorhizobium sp.]|uniref:hypothetical protein n=1 Tax=Mesorhizobium sp. TaxID=1871066 RepID=UPI0025F6773B|nr:hypothetical protein [Mesorhizobium sp.]